MPRANGQIEPEYGWVISLAFWLSLLLAAGLYGGVALAPKYLAYVELRAHHYAGQVQLVQLEQQVRYLERVAEALEHDRHFAEELARADFEARRPGDERISVASHLTVDAPIEGVDVHAPIASMPWYSPILRALARNQKLRKTTLFVAVALVLVSFTFLHESQERELRTGLRRAKKSVGFFVDRYWRAE